MTVYLYTPTILSSGFKSLQSFIRSLGPIAYWPLDESPAGTPYVTLPGNTSNINCGSGATLDDLATAAMTIDMWIAPHIVTAFGKFITKADSGGTNGWLAQWDGTNQNIQILIVCTTTNAITRVSFPLNADVWRHLTLFYDDTGDRKVYVAVDGVWVTSYLTQQAGVDAYLSDASNSLLFGNRSALNQGWNGSYGWARISNNDRFNHGVDFTPPSRTTTPAVDANTVSLWPMNEGYGSVAGDIGANNNDGTITNGSWAAYPAAQDVINGWNTTPVGVLIGQSVPPLTAYYFDGVNDYVPLPTGSMAATWPAQILGKLTINLFAKSVNPSVASDALWMQAPGAASYLGFTLNGANQWLLRYKVTGEVNQTMAATTDLVMLSMTLDHAANEVKFYMNGVQQGATKVSPGAWSGGLIASVCNIGAFRDIPDSVFLGWICHVAYWDYPLSASTLLSVAKKAGL